MTASSRAAAATALSLPGAEGMTALKYIAPNTGRTVWTGPVSHARYVFSGSSDAKRVQLVDKRDVEGMLDIREGRRPVFQRYVAPAPAPVVAAAPVVAEEPVAEAVPEAPVPPAPVPAEDPLVLAAAAEAEEVTEIAEAPKRRRRGRKDA